MHRVGHYLGLDVHDVGGKKENGEWTDYVPGMITTIEPGIYINNSLNGPDKYKNIGSRIEDNVLVTENSFEGLTNLVPKKIKDIIKGEIIFPSKIPNLNQMIFKIVIK